MLRDNLLNLSSGPSWPDLTMSVIYLYEQGAHMPLIHNSPDPERHKKPLWRGWQLPSSGPPSRNPWNTCATGVWATFT